MKKLLLNLDELAVESYETEKQPASRGTVVGHDGTDTFGEGRPAT